MLQPDCDNTTTSHKSGVVVIDWATIHDHLFFYVVSNAQPSSDIACTNVPYPTSDAGF
jgi:hypothetical protein